MSRALLVLLLALGACEEEGADPSEPTDVVDPMCAEAPEVTWDNFGAGFLTQHCASCHSESSPDRNGAPTSIVMDEEDQVWGLADQILEAATGDNPYMPPQGGVDADDRYLLEVWLGCE